MEVDTEMKKIVAILLVVALLASLPAVGVFASESEVVSVEIPRIHRHQNRTAGAFEPTLAPGHHQSYLDRLDDVPEYALKLYRWLEENAHAGGALADPSLTKWSGDGYYHVAHQIADKLTFTFSSYEELATQADTLATEALNEAFDEFHVYAGAIYDVFDREHPEVFWLNGESSYNYSGSYYYTYWGNVCTVYYFADLLFWLQFPGFDIRYESYRTTDAIAEGIRLRDDAIEGILSDCPEDSQEAQVRYLNDALTHRNAYNQAIGEGRWSEADPLSWECISALTGRTGDQGPVCEGYSRAFMVLCQRLGIPCVLVDGAARPEPTGSSEEHMWNYVKLDGQWYALDVTWNDPFVRNWPDAAVSGLEDQNWMLLGGDSIVAPAFTFLQSHVVKNDIASNGFGYINGPVLASGQYVPGAKLPKLSGAVTTANDLSATITLSNDQSVTVDGKCGSYEFADLTPGTYTLIVTKDKHCPKVYEVTVDDEDVKMDVRLNLYGDVSSDGKINMGDVAKIFAYTRKSTAFSDDYIVSCADVTGDTKVNMGDVARVFSHVRGKKPL